ncbi:MAG: 2-oxoacid:acceptor oxidoreductase subunit alpha [Candidatus Hodarchaeales archaeon]
MISDTEYPLKDSSREGEYNRFSLRWGGAAGDGLQYIGLLLQKYLNRIGYFVQGFPGTQSTIRGGHVWQHVEFATKQIRSFDRPLDLLIAFNSVTLDVHLQDLKKNGFLIFNSDMKHSGNHEKVIATREIQVIEIPLKTLAKEIDRSTPVLANSIAVGALLKLLNLDLTEFKTILEQKYIGREEILNKNIAALTKGYNYYSENFKIRSSCCSSTLDRKDRLIINGNHMIALGAVASGLKFLAQYPITPASSILTYLANRAEKYGIVVRQTEDELAAITMCIGASFAGARSMTASSGPGISLMSEALGYAAMTETPIVIVDSMRAGPSTGIPTKMEQADLASVIHSSHGESPRVVLAPRNIQECFEITTRAFNIADRYQIPVIVLSDFALSERTESIEPFSLDVNIDRGKVWEMSTKEHPVFKRFQLTEDGISPRAFPPTRNAEYILVGAEHDEYSHSLSGNRCGLPLSGKIRENMFEKRFRKMEVIRRQEMNPPDVYGASHANHTILCWGSTQGAVMEVVDHLNSTGEDSWNMLSFFDLFPLPSQKIHPFLKKIKHSIFFEVNYTGQLENVIHSHLNWKADARIHSLSGETPTPSYILKELEGKF